MRRIAITIIVLGAIFIALAYKMAPAPTCSNYTPWSEMPASCQQQWAEHSGE